MTGAWQQAPAAQAGWSAQPGQPGPVYQSEQWPQVSQDQAVTPPPVPFQQGTPAQQLVPQQQVLPPITPPAGPVLTAADPTVYRSVRELLLDHFRHRTKAVVEIPFDRSSRTAARSGGANSRRPPARPGPGVGATVANCPAEHDETTRATRRS